MVNGAKIIFFKEKKTQLDEVDLEPEIEKQPCMTAENVFYI